MSIASRRAALAAGLATTGDHVDTYERDIANPPCLIVGNPVGTYADDFEGDFAVTFPVLFLAGRGDLPSAEAEIDLRLETSGTKSVPAAVEAVEGAAVVRFTNYGGGYTFGEIEYVGVTFEVEML